MSQIDDYCREISAWIEPRQVLETMRRRHEEPELANRRVPLILASRVLQSGEEGALRKLVELYLGNFRFPEGLLAMLRPSLDSDDLAWLADLRFEGDIHVDVDVERLREDMRPVLAIVERDMIIDLLTPSLLMLHDTVGAFAQMWKQFVGQLETDQLFLKHSSNGFFPVFVERHVAEAYGFTGLGDAGVATESGSVNLNYRSVTLAGGRAPFDAKLIGVVREVARTSIV